MHASSEVAEFLCHQVVLFACCPGLRERRKLVKPYEEGIPPRCVLPLPGLCRCSSQILQLFCKILQFFSGLVLGCIETDTAENETETDEIHLEERVSETDERLVPRLWWKSADVAEEKKSEKPHFCVVQLRIAFGCVAARTAGHDCADADVLRTIGFSAVRVDDGAVLLKIESRCESKMKLTHR